MVQRKVPSKLSIQVDNVKSDKRLANVKLSSSQVQDGKIRGADMKKKKKKLRSIKLSDLKTLQTSPPKKTLSQPGRPPPPLHAPTNATSPQKQQPLAKTTDESPNYMKPTSSSCAKKEPFSVSLRNTEMGSDFKSQRPNFFSNIKNSSVSGKKPVKALSRSTSLELVRTLRKTPSFKPSRVCPRKSSRVALRADIDVQIATCSSTLKDSKFPNYLMLNPGGTESEGTSVMKVCPCTYCSLNGHRHAPLPPLKSFLSARRRVLKTQKYLKLESLSPRRLKVPCQKKKESEIEQNVFDEKPAYHEADTANSNVTPLVQEIGMDFLIEIYANEEEVEAQPAGAEPNGDKMGEICYALELKNQDDIKSTIEEDSMLVRGDNDIKQVLASVSDGSPKSEIDFEEDFKKYFDDVTVEADNSESNLQVRKAEHVDGDSQPIWSNKEVSVGSGYSEIRCEMDCSDSEATDMDCEERQFWASEHEENAVSSVFTEEGAHSKVECLSESSHDASVKWLDDILCNYYEDIMADELLQDPRAEESTCFDAQARGDDPDLEGTSESKESQESVYSSNDITCDQSSLTEEVFQDLTNGEENGRENEACEDTEKTIEEPKENSKENQEKDEVLQAEILMTRTLLELGDDENNCITEVLDGASDNGQEDMSLKDQKLLQNDQGKAKTIQRSSCIDVEDQSTGRIWRGARSKKLIEDDEEMRKFNPREPNFLPLAPDPEAEKVDLKHQMMDERKNAEEWMLDYALRQEVTKLAPARKRKVALLVEAFEKVMPPPKYETRVKDNSTFSHARPMQACR